MENKDVIHLSYSGLKLQGSDKIESYEFPGEFVGGLNELIQIMKQQQGIDSSKISDGFHTFDELYEHRCVLYIALCRILVNALGELAGVWKSEKHSDGTIWNGWFLLGIFSKAGYQITYHLPTSKWNDCSFAKVVDQAPPFDGHTPADVLSRLSTL